MPVSVQVSVVINRPVDRVFQFYARDHVRNHPRWDPDMQLEGVSEGPIGVGTVIRRRNTHSGTPVEGTMEVVEFDPDRSIGMVIREGAAETHGRATFTPEGPARTTLTISAEFPDLPESMQDRMTGLVERSAQHIKQLVEAEG